MLHQDDEVVGVHEAVVVSDDVWVFHAGKHIDLQDVSTEGRGKTESLHVAPYRALVRARCPMSQAGLMAT